ncbi:hypothetical protein PENTCL1PPCAC_21323, partial [Pristionchus entomophagus]
MKMDYSEFSKRGSRLVMLTELVRINAIGILLQDFSCLAWSDRSYAIIESKFADIVVGKRSWSHLCSNTIAVVVLLFLSSGRIRRSNMFHKDSDAR